MLAEARASEAGARGPKRPSARPSASCDEPRAHAAPRAMGAGSSCTHGARDSLRCARRTSAHVIQRLSWTNSSACALRGADLDARNNAPFEYRTRPHRPVVPRAGARGAVWMQQLDGARSRRRVEHRVFGRRNLPHRQAVDGDGLHAGGSPLPLRQAPERLRQRRRQLHQRQVVGELHPGVRPITG